MAFLGKQIFELYRRGLALFVLAPLILAIVMLPEFLQHIAEIQIGFFDSHAGAKLLANDPTRWAFGYAKLTGLLIGMLAAARYWGTRARGRKWWQLGDIRWVTLILSMLLFVGLSAAVGLLEHRIPDLPYKTLYWGTSIAVLPVILPIVGALLGDPRAHPLRDYWHDWRWLPLLVLLLGLAYLPGMAAHYGFHYLAFGAPRPIVWLLMILDPFAVGLIAANVGAALSLTYEAARGAGAAAHPEPGAASDDEGGSFNPA
ncbi:hypothetical protein HZY97_04930 [Sphingomonas sp. R-74633]|uniref:hypothetical protein n=1 Tax=Sphingomonas sp. R-74633 TaxID=2751188 RepID=UPI0015D424A6|nr:hypothetical protein [Sphingomonas sp. R-74633]NYT40089.1 hypothetical protein [Sphingomonas sp. R-74633]